MGRWGKNNIKPRANDVYHVIVMEYDYAIIIKYY